MKEIIYYDSICGILKIEIENNHLISLKKVDKKEKDLNLNSSTSKKTIKQLDEYFSGERKSFDISILPKGTEFQKNVWNQLIKIPYGETKSYKEVATSLGDSKKARAVGMANNKNPIGIIIPCHRVIGSDGKLIGYAGGIKMKETLLNLEKNN